MRVLDEKRDALVSFHDVRNIIVHQVLYSGSSLSSDARKFAIDAVSETKEYNALLSHDVSDTERFAILHGLFEVATMLMSEVECSAGVPENKKDDYSFTGETASVLSSKLDAAHALFDGVVSLEALTLMYGYDADDVSLLTADEVSYAFDIVCKVGVQVPWSFILSCMQSGIDGDLASSVAHTNRPLSLAVR
jgi:hypothetical protein